MKEYKLSRISKYSVLYLLCGLFMFFFMFAILSLNSHASSTDYVLNITSSNGTFFETSGLYHSFSSSLSHPEYAYPITTVSGSSSFTRPSGVESVNLEVHVVTSDGDFVVDTHQGTGSYEAFSSVKLSGYPIGYYGVCKGYLKEGTSSTTMTMNVSCSASVSNQSTNVTTSLNSINNTLNDVATAVGVGASDSIVNSHLHDFYSSYNLATNLYNITVPSSFGGGGEITSGSPIDLSFPNYSSSSIVTNGIFSPMFYRPLQGKMILSFTYSGNPLTDASIVYYDARTPYYYSLTDLVRTYQAYKNGKLFNTYELYIDVEDIDVQRIGYFNFISTSNSDSSFSDFSYRVYQYVGSLSDYMSYVKDTYTDISPSVDSTNQNISQTVSDVNTINSFETTTFNNFDSLAETSGLTSFSMTSDTHVASGMNFLSSCIVTVYNGFPSDLKWLIQCIGIFGIFALLLSVFGRVGKRINNE